MQELSVLYTTARGSCPGAKGNKSNQYMQQNYLWTTREQIHVSRAGQLYFDSDICFKGLLRGRFKLQHSNRADALLQNPGTDRASLQYFIQWKQKWTHAEAFPGTYWTLAAWCTGNYPGLWLFPRPRATFQPLAQGMLCGSLSSAAQPEPGARSALTPARSSSSAGKWNTGTKYGRETQETPLRPPQPGNKDPQDELCRQSDLGFLCARGYLKSRRILRDVS